MPQPKLSAAEYFHNDEFAETVWKTKYGQAWEDNPDDMHKRMAKEFARVRFKKDKSKTQEQWQEYFFDIFKNFQKNIPQGRVMAGLGVYDSYRSLSNCLRLPPPNDSYSSIMKTDTMLVSAAKRGCGYGVGLSKLRPRGAATQNSSKTSTGVTIFGERYSNSTKEVGQEGRRGACLEDLDIRHPESPAWATVKLDKQKITGANISFKMWDGFMKAVVEDGDYILRFPVDIHEEDIKLMSEKWNLEYNVMTKVEFSGLHERAYGRSGYLKKVKARELWNNSIHSVWSDGCPGLQFWEQITGYDPSSVYKKYAIDGTNACGEQPMAVFDTCRLLTQMLLAVVDKPFTPKAKINYDKLYEYSYIQMEIGDDLIDLEIEYIERIISKVKDDPEDDSEKAIELELWEKVLDMAKSGRRVGGGITALADMLAAVGLKYDSEEALKVVDKVMRTKFEAELDASMDLAEKYGTFDGWDPKLEKDGNNWYRFVEKEFPDRWKRMQKVGRRFVNWSTIAPVGTTSIVTIGITYPNVSSGCEPQFALYFFRNKKVEKDGDLYDYIDETGIKWKQYPIMMGAFKDWLTIAKGITDFDSLTKDDLDSLYAESPWYKATAGDIDWRRRIDMQAVLQKYTTSAISSTINLPNDASEALISEIYLYAWEKKLKGITCYRDGSKGGVLVHDKVGEDQFNYQDAMKRPKEMLHDIHHVSLKGDKFTVLVGLVKGKPYEVFVLPYEIAKEFKTGFLIKKKSGVYNLLTSLDEEVPIATNVGEKMSDVEAALTRMISAALRHRTDIKFIVEQLNKTHGDLFSFSKVIARVLKKYIPEGAKSTVKCSECGGDLIFQEGCQMCPGCGNSKC